MSRPPAVSGALRQATHLLALQGTSSARRPALHVVAAGDNDEAAFDDAVRRAVGELQETISLTTGVVESADVIAALRDQLSRGGEEGDGGLLVLDPPSDRSPAPPLAADRTQALVAALSCPIFLVEEGRTPPSIDRILVPTDLSHESVHALRHATELAVGYAASVELLHVIDKSPYVALTPVDRLSLGSTTLTEHRARRRLQQFLEEAHSPDVPVRTRVAFGDPADRIAHVVTDRAMDVLVLASHGGGSAPGSSLGPLVNRVLQRVACPTFLVGAGNRALLPGPENATSTVDPDG